MPLRGLLLVIFFMGSLPFCLFRPFYGVILWVVVAFLNPQSYTWSAFDVFPWGMAVAIPTLGGMLLFDRRFDRLKGRDVWLLAALWAWFTLTTVVSVNTAALAHHATDTWDRWEFVSKILIMTFCLIPIVSSFARLRALLVTIACCFGFYVAKAFPFIIATGGAFKLYGPDKSMVADNTDFGLALNMTLPLYFYLARTETRPAVKWVFRALFLMTIPAIFFTYSRGAVLGLVVVAGVMMLRSKRRYALIPAIVLAAVFAVGFAPDKWKERMDPTSGQVLDASAQSRLNAWAFARGLAADYPITGGGFATFTPELYDQYWPAPIGTIYGPHSVYFQVLAEHGYVGLVLYLSVVVSCFATTRRLRKHAREVHDAEVDQYARMLELSLIGFLVSGVFLGRAYFDYYFTIVACVIVLRQAAQERWAQRLTTPVAAAAAPPPLSAFRNPRAASPV